MTKNVLWHGSVLAALLTVAAVATECAFAAGPGCFFSLDDAPTDAPRFDEFKVKVVPVARPAAADIDHDQKAQRYRTRLRDGAKTGPNFAGHYTVVGWGCGTSCTQWAIVDAVSGRVFFAPALDTVSGVHLGPERNEPEYWALRFRLDSRLLILAGAPQEDETRDGIAYLVWNGKSLAPLRFISRADICTRKER